METSESAKRRSPILQTLDMLITECAVINGYSVGSLALLQPTLGIMPLVFYQYSRLSNRGHWFSCDFGTFIHQCIGDYAPSPNFSGL